MTPRPPAWLITARVVGFVAIIPAFLLGFPGLSRYPWTPTGLLPWAAACLLGTAAAGVFFATDTPTWRRDLGWVGGAAALVTGLYLIVEPREAFDAVPVAVTVEVVVRAVEILRVAGVLVLLAGAVAAARSLWAQRAVTAPLTSPGATTMDRLRAGALALSNEVARGPALLCALLVPSLLFTIGAGGALWEAWVALAVAVVLFFVQPWRAWNRGRAAVLETYPRHPDPGFRWWRGVTVAWLIAATASHTMRRGDLTGFFWWVCLVFLAGMAAWFASLPEISQQGPKAEEQEFAGWLHRGSGRRAEIEAWRDRAGDPESFGPLPWEDD